MNDVKLLEKYNEIWKIVSSIIKKEFYSNPVYNEKYINSKTKTYNGKINTHFHNNEVSKQCSQCISLSIVLIDLFYKKHKNCYLQVFLEEYKYVIKGKKKSKFISEGTGISYGDSDEENVDKENQV